MSDKNVKKNLSTQSNKTEQTLYTLTKKKSDSRYLTIKNL